jgi:hypothetical protein
VQVSAEGEIVWVFPSGFQDTIRNKSLLLRLEPTLAGKQTGPQGSLCADINGSSVAPGVVWCGGVQAKGGIWVARTAGHDWQVIARP